jgi:hypothetical protein
VVAVSFELLTTESKMEGETGLFWQFRVQYTTICVIC